MGNETKILVDFMKNGARFKRDLEDRTIWLVQKARGRLCVSVREKVGGQMTEFTLDSDGFILDATHRELGNNHEAPLNLDDAYRSLYAKVLDHPIFLHLRGQNNLAAAASNEVNVDGQDKLPALDSNQDPSEEVAA